MLDLKDYKVIEYEYFKLFYKKIENNLYRYYIFKNNKQVQNSKVIKTKFLIVDFKDTLKYLYYKDNYDYKNLNKLNEKLKKRYEKRKEVKKC